MSNQFLLTWIAPNNGTINDYIIEYSPQNSSNWSIYDDGISIAPSSIVSINDSCSLYKFRVAAVNSVGTGLYSNTASGILANKPDAPYDLSAIIGDKHIKLSWTEPYDGGCPISSYVIEYYKDNEQSFYLSTGGSDIKYILLGLSNNSNYSVRIAAINSVGTGLYSTLLTQLQPLSRPSRVLDPEAYLQDANSVGISWKQPNGDLTDYLIEYSNNNGISWNSTPLLPSGTTYTTINNLVNGYTYSFRISAINTTVYGPVSLIPSTVAISTPYDNLFNKTRLLLRMDTVLQYP